MVPDIVRRGDRKGVGRIGEIARWRQEIDDGHETADVAAVGSDGGGWGCEDRGEEKEERCQGEAGERRGIHVGGGVESGWDVGSIVKFRLLGRFEKGIMS